MQLKSIAFWFWATLIARFGLAFLFFRDQPKMATFLQALISLGFAFLLLILRLSTHLSFSPLPRPKVLTWVLVYALWTGLSLTWTFSDSVLSAAGYWTVMLLDISIVIGTLTFDDLDAIAIASLKGLVCGTYILDIIALLFANNDEYGRLGDPEFLHPNNLGHFTSLAALVSVFFWQRAPYGTSERRLWGAGSVLLSWMIMRTLSKTSIVAFAVAVLFSLLLGSRQQIKVKLRIGVISVALLVATYGFVSHYVATYFDDSGDSVTTLTGRTTLWIQSWDMIAERPALGYGILSFRNYAPQNWEIRTVHGHNEWITQAFQLGFIGVALTAIVYGSYYRHLSRTTESFRKKLGISILMFILIEGMASAEPIGLLFPLPLIVLMSIWTDSTREGNGLARYRRESSVVQHPIVG